MSKPPDFRRKWDRNFYEKAAEDKANADLDSLRNVRKDRPVVKRDFLKARNFTIDLEANVNKSQVISKTGPGSSQAGYYCEVCDCVVKDSINYLDHINGKKHQRNLGMSMRIKRSTLDDIKSRFAHHQKRKEEKAEEYNLDERMKQIEEEEERARSYRREKRKAKKRKNDNQLFEDEDVSATMGFGGFGTSKRSK